MNLKLGDVLLRKNIISRDTFKSIPNEKRESIDIVEYLIFKKLVEEELLYSELSELIKVPLIKLSDLEIKGKVIDSFKKETLEKYVVFPVEITGSLLTLAMKNPVDKGILSEISEITGMEIFPVLSSSRDIVNHIDKFYNIDESVARLLSNDNSEDRDRYEIQAVNRFSKLAADNKSFKIVIVDTPLGIQLNKVSTDVISIKEAEYILNFIKKSTSLSNSNDSGIYQLELPYNDNFIHVNIIVNNVGLNMFYWIEAVYVDKIDGNETDGLSGIDSNGLYVLSNERFKNKDKLMSDLLGLHKRLANGILVYTNDKNFDNYGINTFFDEIENIKYYRSFADAFVFENGWDEKIIDAVFDLLNEGKIVILQLPFDEDTVRKYLKDNKRSLYVLLEGIIKV